MRHVVVAVGLISVVVVAVVVVTTGRVSGVLVLGARTVAGRARNVVGTGVVIVVVVFGIIVLVIAATCRLMSRSSRRCSGARVVAGAGGTSVQRVFFLRISTYRENVLDA